MDPDCIEQDRRAVAAVVITRCTQVLPRPDAARIAAYVPLRTEPASLDLLDGLVRLGAEVIVPVLLPDNDLDWRVWQGSGSDDGDRLGVDAVASAAVVLVPALAVDRAGIRLGRGGGSYDRALARVPAGVPKVALVYADEVLASVPREPWDLPVSAVATPAGWTEVCGK
jgi:5-formyltetrahydrofolate cyclo-ligase